MSKSLDDRRLPGTEPVSPIEGLQARAIAMLGERLPTGGRWVALDYPMHWNVGDAANALAQTRTARRLGASIVRVLDRVSYHPHLLEPGALPVIQGGGNWGGLYPTHHQLRLRVLEDTRGRDVIQMPQSIHYASEEHREELRRAVGRHGRLTLLVRDRRSYEIAVRDYDCEVHLVPDLVLSLGRLPAPPARVDVLMQGRTDREAPQGAPGASASVDWLIPPRLSLSRATARVAVRTNRLQPRLPPGVGGFASVQTTTALSAINVRRGLAMLGRGRYIVTDRLHGHVLSHLLGRPHVVVDDRNGKIRALHETWLTTDPRSVLVPSWADVPRALDELREEFPQDEQQADRCVCT